MKTSKALLISLLLLTTIGFTVKGQSTAKDCDIKVESKVTNPDPGRKNGKIELTFPDTRKYKVFVVNAGEELAKKDSGKVIEDLAKGFYDIIIVDDKGCFKQITVTLN
jgi:hypothetical protein